MRISTTTDVMSLADRFDAVLGDDLKAAVLAETQKWLEDLNAAYKTRFAGASGTRSMTADLIMGEELASLGL